MTVTDDPVVPDDLRDVLRSASEDLDVTPAELPTVEHRARQRTRRRHGLVASGAAAVLLLGGLVVARAVTGSDGTEHLSTATTGSPAAEGSAPQPLLARFATGDQVSGELRDMSVDGAPLWWHAPSGWQAIEGVVLADGRRFAVAVGQPGSLQQGTYRLSEIGPDGETIRTDDLPIDVPDGWEATANRLVGATGSELIVAQETQSGYPDPPPAGGFTIDTATKVVALDVDTRSTRILVDGEPAGTSGAAGDLLARSNATDCSLILQNLHGDAAARTVDGGCPPGIDGLEGMAMSLAVSPDGRYVAAVWNMIRTAGLPDNEVIVLDATDGRVVYRGAGDPQHLVRDLAWTGDTTLMAAIDPGSQPLPTGDGPVRVASVEVPLDT